jgi:GNAT superfamily N-acetyltransferase
LIKSKLETETLKTGTVVTTYLEMRAPAASRRPKSQVSGQKFRVRELKEPNWVFNRDMYFRVGENWKWIDKRPWTDEQWKEYANDFNLRTFAGHCEDEVAGYFELRRSRNNLQPRIRAGLAIPAATEDDIEIAYFGLLPKFIGRGLGSALLTSAMENAWKWSPMPARVWVHTCNRDHPSALNNYKARGFRVYKVERENF